ncbi:MAG: DUF6328 family protein [Propionicimonas sp.]|nr:DUF6328 family protein [Propionicimonas sp.]
MTDDQADTVDPPERDERPAERLDRNWSELLQELRVTQTGIQILSGFLLTLPFQARFAELDPVLVAVFLAAVVLGTLATCVIVAPVTAHRLLFRRHAKDVLVSAGDLMAKAGLALLALAVTMVVALVFGFVLDPVAGLVAGAVALAGFVLLWVVVPFLLTRREGEARYR